MTHVGIFPAVGSGLGSMARTGQLERLYVHLGAYADRFSLTYHTYLDYADEAWYWRRFYRQTGAALVQARASTVRQAFLWPLRDARRFKTLQLCRVMSLRGVPPALLAYWLWRIPFVVSFGNDYEGIARLHHRRTWPLRWLRRCAERWAAAIFVNNQVRARHMQGTNPRVHWIPSWVDTARFSPSARRTFVRNRSRRRLLYVGRFVVEKNLVPVAHVARALGMEFVCLGAGPEESALRAAGAVCLGIIPWEELPGWYRGADAFILPSLVEGHPKALLEAMACDVPCLISNALDGCRELSALRFNPTHSESIAAAMRARHHGMTTHPRSSVLRYDRQEVLSREVDTVARLCPR